MDIRKRIDVFWPYLHAIPEPAFREMKTSAFVAEVLRKAGYEVQEKVGDTTGVVGVLDSGRPGPVAAVRSDMDCLLFKQEDGTEKAVHACGHDSHTGSLLAAERILSAMREEIHGSVKFLFQPAEELNLGAKLMVKQGCLENPHVDALFGLHNSPEIPAGTVAVKNGPLMAAVNRINMKITGAGGHGGIPQRNVDPIVCAASIILSAQTIVSRNTSPFDPCVLSICNVRAGEGTTNNVTPNEVRMYGTVRAFREENIDLIEKRLREIIENTAAAYQCEGELEFIRELSVTGAKELYPVGLAAASEVAVPVDPVPSTGGEDFSAFQDAGANCFFYWLGTRNEEKDCVYSWHSPKFQFDPACLKIGGGLYSMSVFKAIEYLKSEEA